MDAEGLRRRKSITLRIHVVDRRCGLGIDEAKAHSRGVGGLEFVAHGGRQRVEVWHSMIDGLRSRARGIHEPAVVTFFVITSLSDEYRQFISP